MGNQMRKLQIRTANNGPQSMPMEFVHVGTSDFFKPQVIHCQEVKAGDSVNLSTIVNMKGKPMQMPGEIQIKHNLHAFWVPNFATHPDWFAFRTQLPFKWRTNGTYSKHIKDLYTYNTDFVNLFCTSKELNVAPFIKIDSVTMTNYNVNYDPETEATKYDIVLSTFDSTKHFYNCIMFNLTDKGRIMYNLLHQLGYEIDWRIIIAKTKSEIDSFLTDAKQILQFHENSIWPETDDWDNATEIAVRPIINFFKIMIDYFIPAQYSNDLQNKLDEVITNGPSVTLHYNTLAINCYDLFIALMEWINYDIDRFTGAWTNPTGPNNSETTISIKDKTITNQTDNQISLATNSEVSKTPMIVRGDNLSGTPARITDYILRALDAIQNYTTRNRIAGYRPIDRFLAHFGQRLDYIHTKRSQYIDGSHANISVIDVTAMAQTDGATVGPTGTNDPELLGGQAAKIGGSIGIEVNWKADDDGWIYIIDTLIPRHGYYQGIKNHCLRVNWLDMYNPEFDNLGTQPIRRIEIMHAFEGSTIAANDEQIWGWEPTYAGMKTGWDTKSGDRRIRTLNTGLDSMDLFRHFPVTGSKLGNSITSDFLRGENEQYDRIFAYMKGDVDHFYFSALTRDEGSKAMKSISESLPLTDGEGKTVEFQYGGGNYIQ